MNLLQRADITLESRLKSRLELELRDAEWWSNTLSVPISEITPERIAKEIKEVFEELDRASVWKNELYTVHLKEVGGGVQELSIRRNDRKPVTDWRHKQEIKNQLCGPEREGIEIYPAESRKVDSANQYYIFVMPEGVKIPFGFQTRLVSEDNIGNSQQRRFGDEQ